MTETVKKKKTDERTRYFATLAYPTQKQYESYYAAHNSYTDKETGEVITIPKYNGEEGWGETPDDWIETLDELHIAILISPMHIADHNPDGTIKKPHWHVLFIFEGKKNFETQVKPLFKKIKGVGREEVMSLRGYARYLLHMDNPEKFQYSEENLISLGGADFKTITQLPGDTLEQFRQLKEFVNRNKIISYATLLDLLEQQRPDLEYSALYTNGIQIMRYIKSKVWMQSTDGINATFDANKSKHHKQKEGK